MLRSLPRCCDESKRKICHEWNTPEPGNGDAPERGADTLAPWILVLTLTFCGVNIALQGPGDLELVVSKLPGLTPRDLCNYTLES